MSGMSERRRRRWAVLGLGAALTCALLGCTSGDDGADAADAVIADDGGESAATVAAAIDAARAGTGRFALTLRDSIAEGDGGAAGESVGSFRGEFAGDALAWTVGGGDVADGAGPELRVREVDDRTYLGTERLRARVEMETEGFVAVTNGDEAGGFAPSSAASWDTAVLDGKDWIDVTELLSDAGTEVDLDPAILTSIAPSAPVDPFDVVDLVTGVADQGAADLEGVTARRFTGTVSMGALVDLLTGEQGEDADETDEHAARQAAVDRYVEEHAAITAEVYLDDQDRLLRVEIRARSEVEDRYRDCWVMPVLFDELTVSVDFTDLGADIRIDPPDPATVLSLADLAAAFPDTFTPVGSVTAEGSFPSSVPDAVDESIGTVETVDGPRDRDAVVNDLSKFGYVIGLVPDPWTADPDRSRVPSPHVRADGVAVLSDDELAQKYAEVDAVLGAMPTTQTALGTLTRPELLWNVKVGMRNLGVDLAVADGLSDAQLGELIDGYVADNGWVVGDGIWGDMDPALIAQFHSQSSGPSPEDLGPSVDPEFERCPG